MSNTTRGFGLPWRTTKTQPNVIVNCGGNTWLARALIGSGKTPRLHGDAEFAEDVANLIVAAVNAYEGNKARIAELEAEVARLREALTPSGDTKGAYSGEFTFTDSTIYVDEDGAEHQREIMVPWTTIKEIMKAIIARAALRSQS